MNTTLKNHNTMKHIRIALFAILAALVMSSCQPPASQEADQAATAEAPKPQEIKVRPVKVMPLEYRNTAISQTVTSTVVAYEETYLSPGLSGKIRDVKVDVNDRVKKGQLLVEMDRTQLDQTQLQYEQLKVDLARLDTLLSHGSITQQAFDQMKSQVETTELIIKNLKENTLIRAPYSGVITGKYYNDGELYSPSPNTPAGKPALITMMQVDPVKLLVNLSEKNIPLVKKGMKAAVSTEVYHDEVFEGSVFRVHPTISPATRTFTAEVKVPNRDGRLAPGMFARVSLKMGERDAMIVPAIAVLQQRGTNQRYVMINENGTAKKVSVTILSRMDDQLEIASATLQGGEELIYVGQSSLENGAPVQVVVE